MVARWLYGANHESCHIIWWAKKLKKAERPMRTCAYRFGSFWWFSPFTWSGRHGWPGLWWYHCRSSCRGKWHIVWKAKGIKFCLDRKRLVLQHECGNLRCLCNHIPVPPDASCEASKHGNVMRVVIPKPAKEIQKHCRVLLYQVSIRFEHMSHNCQ